MNRDAIAGRCGVLVVGLVGIYGLVTRIRSRSHDLLESSLGTPLVIAHGRRDSCSRSANRPPVDDSVLVAIAEAELVPVLRRIARY